MVAGDGLGDRGEALGLETVIHAKQCWSIKVKGIDMYGSIW